MAVTGFVPPDVGDDEHIVRRLGWAILRQWPDLPEDVKELIQLQAVFTEDRHMTVQLNEQVTAFIEEHSGGG